MSSAILNYIITLMNIHARMVSSGLLRRVALVRTDVSEEPGASFIGVTKIGDFAAYVSC
jgi:hypothetical protein